MNDITLLEHKITKDSLYMKVDIDKEIIELDIIPKQTLLSSEIFKLIFGMKLTDKTIKENIKIFDKFFDIVSDSDIIDKYSFKIIFCNFILLRFFIKNKKINF
ncbi:MAG: hypothetical protein ABSG25_05735 [Bryobacteraceae bacterium]